MSKKTKTNIYYLEDNQKHFNTIQDRLEKRLRVKVFPEKENWKSRLSRFRNYLSTKSRADKLVFVEELLEDKVALIILDQQINGYDHVGANVFDHIIKKEPSLKDLKVIIFSGADSSQRAPGSYLAENLIILPKKDLEKESDILIQAIKSLLAIDDVGWLSDWGDIDF